MVYLIWLHKGRSISYNYLNSKGKKNYFNLVNSGKLRTSSPSRNLILNFDNFEKIIVSKNHRRATWSLLTLKHCKLFSFPINSLLRKHQPKLMYQYYIIFLSSMCTCFHVFIVHCTLSMCSLYMLPCVHWVKNNYSFKKLFIAQ